MKSREAKDYQIKGADQGLDLCIKDLCRQLGSLNWLDVAFGRAFDHLVIEDNRTYRKPMVYVGGKEYEPMTPNDNLNSMSFFKAYPTAVIDFKKPESRRVIHTERLISIIVWFDARKVPGYETEDYPLYDVLVPQVINLLSVSPHVKQIHETAEEDIVSVFRGYDFQLRDLKGYRVEGQTTNTHQFLMYPYGAFRIDFTVKYSLSPVCQ